MAGRIRTIKPELLEDAVTAGLSDMALRIFVAAILLADDYGRLRAETGWLLGQIYWARAVQVEHFIAALAELDRLVQFYEINGQRYAEIRNWSKHQKVSHPGKPRIPEPLEGLTKLSGESPETLVPDHRPGITDQGSPTRGGTREPLVETPTEQPSPPPRVWGRGATAERALEVFADAISSVTGEPFVVGPAMFLRDDVCALMNRCGPKVATLGESLTWLGDTVQAWVHAVPVVDDRKPSKLIAWLNAGKPDRKRKGGPKVVAVQSMDGACFKIPEGF